MLKGIYRWTINWAKTPYATWALFFIALAESSFFPIPPDVLLIAMGIAAPKRGLFYALISTIGSVLGGIIGYLIGWQFMATLGQHIVQFYGLSEKYLQVQNLYQSYDVWATFLGGFTPLPYKLFTIAAGVFNINFAAFLITSIVARGARFFLVGTVIYFSGLKIQNFIEKNLNFLTTGFAAILILGYLFLKIIF